MKDGLDIAPWQEQLVKMFEDRGEIFSGMPRRDMRWEFHWMTQLMWMRAMWMKGFETKFISGYFERVVRRPNFIIFDEMTP